jgi:hypothetical protein
MSAGERQGMKEGNVRGVQVLELCCPLAGQWDRAVALVKAHDPLGRPVRRNRNFTAAWAESELRRCGEA